MAPLGASASELVARLEQLEAAGGISTRGTMSAAADEASPAAAGGRTPDALAEAQVADLRSVGRIAVQLFLRRRLLLSDGDAAAWDAQVDNSPVPATSVSSTSASVIWRFMTSSQPLPALSSATLHFVTQFPASGLV